MVEQSVRLDSIFSSLSDATRRDILKRVTKSELSISALADSYRMSFAAIAKHVSVLADAGLIKKRKEGRQQLISANASNIKIATVHLQQYEKLWNERFAALDDYLNK